MTIKQIFKPNKWKIILALLIPVYFSYRVDFLMHSWDYWPNWEIGFKFLPVPPLSALFFYLYDIFIGIADITFDTIVWLSMFWLIAILFLNFILPLILNYAIVCLLLFFGQRFSGFRNLSTSNIVERINLGGKRNFLLFVLPGLFLYICVSFYIINIQKPRANEELACEKDLKDFVLEKSGISKRLEQSGMENISDCKAEKINIEGQDFYLIVINYWVPIDVSYKYTALVHHSLKELHELPRGFFGPYPYLGLIKPSGEERRLWEEESADVSFKGRRAALKNGYYGWIYEYDKSKSYLQKISDGSEEKLRVDFSGSIFEYIKDGKEIVDSSSLYFRHSQYARIMDNYEIYTQAKNEPDWTQFMEDGGVVIVFDDVVVENIKTGEKKIFDPAHDLASAAIKEYMENIPVPVQYYLRAEDLEASKDGARFTGSVELYPSADPPMSVKSSYFQITPGSWRVEAFEKDIR